MERFCCCATFEGKILKPKLQSRTDFDRDLVKTQTQRKLFNSVGSYGAAAGLVWLSFVKCDIAVAVVAISVVVGLQSFVIPGCMVSHTHRS